MAAESGQDVPSRGKAKKKSALTKLVERKKRQVGASDMDSEYGSRFSLQNDNGGVQQQRRGGVPLEPQVIVQGRGTSCVPCKTGSASDLEEKPRPRPRRNSKVSEGTADTGGSGQGDVGSKAHSPSRNGPSDSTIYRFRNMRMAAEHPDSADGKLQGPFVPKPPSTPRTPRTAAVKGEKRNHEPASSGDEPEVGAKRHTLGTNSSHPQDKPQQRGESRSHHRDKSQQKSTTGDSHSYHKDRSQQRLPPGESNSHHKPSAKAASSPAKSSDGVDAVDPANETIDELHSQYQRLIDADSVKDTPVHHRHYSFGSQTQGSDLSTPKSGRLAPLPVTAMPPPMDADMVSHALRTAYKADPGFRPSSSSMLGRLNRNVSDGIGQNGSQGRLGSDNTSLFSASVLPVITIKEARSRSYVEGSVSSSGVSVLGTEELERYFPDHRIHVFVGSWNMNELKSFSESLNDFLLPETCEYVQDIYAIGTQENELNRRDWEVKLQETLGPSHVLYHSVSYGSLHLALFIRRDLMWYCSVPEDDVVSLRAVSVVKTKGAIGISFSMFGTSFLFINCHLTSDRSSSKNKSRLLDYHRVTRELRLPHVVPGKHVHPAVKQEDVTARFDSVFWCGDLNFRLERRRAAVEGKVSQMTDSEGIPHFEELLGADQLSKYVTQGKIFEGFQEGRINFQPTFKFDIHSDKYDSSSKMRIPSYTDRVLWRSRKKNQISCVHYDAVMNIKVSDHRPVYAFFQAMLRPGTDNVPLCAGHFDREVYLQAGKRRAQAQTVKEEKQSSVCSIQ